MVTTITTAGLRRNGNPLLAAMADDWDGHDVWGSTISWGFALAGLATLTGETDGLAGLDYSPGMGLGWEDELAECAQYPDVLAQELWRDGQVSPGELTYALRVVGRLLSVYRAAGLDY